MCGTAMEIEMERSGFSLLEVAPAVGSLSTHVVEIVAVKALWNNSELQLSTAWAQRIQSKAVKFVRFQQTSVSSKNWFGTRFPT
jgi:hypothetical protein